MECAAIGVDVGGTKTAIGLLDAATLTLLAKTVIPTGRERGGEAVLRDIEEHAGSLGGHARALGKHLAGVGVVVPENVSLAGQITSSAVMPGWDKLPVAERLGAVAPTVIDSDVRAAALAEARLGAGAGFGYHAFMTISTGISYCAVARGRPLAGAHGEHGRAHVQRAAVRAGQGTAAGDRAVADPGADRHERVIAEARAGAEPGLGERGGAHVRVDHRGRDRAEPLGDGQLVPPRHDRA